MLLGVRAAMLALLTSQLKTKHLLDPSNLSPVELVADARLIPPVLKQNIRVRVSRPTL